MQPQKERDSSLTQAFHFNSGIQPEVTPTFTQASHFFLFCYAGKYHAR